MFSWDIYTKMFVEGFREKIFDTMTVAALRHALADKASVVRIEAVKFFIAAVAQGMLFVFVRYSYRNVCRGLSGQDIRHRDCRGT